VEEVRAVMRAWIVVRIRIWRCMERVVRGRRDRVEKRERMWRIIWM
jgi:hypothetical protein